MKRSAWRYIWAAKDIRRRLLITLLILAIYRLAAHVPVPGASRAVIAGSQNGSFISGPVAYRLIVDRNQDHLYQTDAAPVGVFL